jgi:hypothetical protein
MAENKKKKKRRPSPKTINDNSGNHDGLDFESKTKEPGVHSDSAPIGGG